MSSERDEQELQRPLPQTTPIRDDTGAETAVAFQRDLYLCWRWAAESRGIGLTSRGYVTRPALRRLRAALAGASGQPAADDDDLGEAQDPRLLFLRRLAQRLGLLRDGEGVLVACEREMMARYVAHPLAERLRICVRVWSAGGWWPDVPDARTPPPRLMAPAPPRLALARRRLLDSLMRLPTGERQSLPSARAEARTRHTGATARPRHPGHSLPTAGEPEAATRYAALTGPLAWLGLVALGGGEPGTSSPTDYTPLPALPAALASAGPLEDDIALEVSGRVVVQPNFEIVAYPPLTAPALLLLDTCAERTALDLTARYRLTRASIAGARVEGWTAADIARRLKALASAPLPANVGVTLADWERHVERVSVSDGVTLLEVRDVSLLDALLADRAAAGWIERRLTPTAALLADGRAEACRAWLLRRGAVPAMTTYQREGDGDRH